MKRRAAGGAVAVRCFAKVQAKPGPSLLPRDAMSALNAMHPPPSQACLPLPRRRATARRAAAPVRAVAAPEAAVSTARIAENIRWEAAANVGQWMQQLHALWASFAHHAAR